MAHKYSVLFACHVSVCTYLCAWRGESACAPVRYTAEQSTSTPSSLESVVFVSWNAAGDKQINKYLHRERDFHFPQTHAIPEVLMF